MKVRQQGRIVSVALIVAVGVNSDGRREVLGMDIGPLPGRDVPDGVPAQARPPRHAWCQTRRGQGAQRHPCRVHFMRNALAHAGKSGRRFVSAFIATAFAQDDVEAAKAQWRKVADQLRPELPKLAGFLDEAETDVLAYMTFSPQHRTKLHLTNRSSVSTTRSNGAPR
ncbi:transposase [Bradyrhizobium genosp. A]|uniref:transposase n=1 Tax=Bradyrhizobium genosp. A TaxID=83626 RepID=UPI003CEEBDA2